MERTNTLVTGYALEEDHGHHYFTATVVTNDSDDRETTTERAYKAQCERTRESGGSFVEFESISIFEGVKIKPLGKSIFVKAFGKVSEYHPSEYPYDCASKTNHPNSEVFTNSINGTWLASHMLKKTNNYYFEYV